MRVSVPSIPQAILSAKASTLVTAAEAIERLWAFAKGGNVTVLTGAGVSVDSGIRAYRGRDGRYMNPNYKPIFYHELIDGTEKGQRFRQRYWLRSYLGYPPVRDALPNTTHFALAALQHSGCVPQIITQNVDGLHHKALRQVRTPTWSDSRIAESILELHGTLHSVRCRRGHVVDRDSFQEMLSTANPKWYHFAQELEETNTKPRTNPDGDVAIENLGISYQDFVVPDCRICLSENHVNSVHKPEVVFFGESIPQGAKERSFNEVTKADKLFLVGTTLATYSAFRLVKHALELKKPVMLLNIGPTRADGLPGVSKIDISSGSVLTEAARMIIGERADADPVINQLLQSGTVRPLLDDDDLAPRAAG